MPDTFQATPSFTTRHHHPKNTEPLSSYRHRYIDKRGFFNELLEIYVMKFYLANGSAKKRKLRVSDANDKQ